MKKFLSLFAAVIMFSVALAHADNALRVGVDPNLKPFVYQDTNGEIKGFDVDIAKALCEDIDMECVFVTTDWDGLIPSLNSRKIDAIVSSMSITDDREKVVDFTRPYYKSPSQLMVKEGFTGLSTGDRVGVLRGSTDEAYANDVFRPRGVVVVSYGNQNEAFLDMKAERLVAVLGPSIELHAGLIDTPDGKGYILFGPMLDDPKYYGPGIGIAVRENDTKLTTDLNDAINRIHDSGEWQSISDKYFDFDIWVQ